MMRDKTSKKHISSVYSFRRLVAGICLVALLFNVSYDLKWPGLSRTSAASSIMDLILAGFVADNLGEAYNYSEVDSALIEEAIRAVHTAGTAWSTVRMQAVLEYIGEKIADTVSENGAAVTINPWTTFSVSSNGSPYEPGKDYNGNAMNAEYTLGQLILDYVRGVETAAVQFTDDELTEMYDHLVGSDDNADPIIDYSALVSAMNVAARAANTGSYSEQPAHDAIDTTNMITYGNYVRSLDKPLPGGYLFIGTWLMDAQVVNATFYRAALNSMTDYDQNIMYYKSELAGNNWRDISGATGLEYILPIAENIQEASLLDYWISVVIGPDGVPKNAKTGETVDIFNITNPYDIENLPELKSLKLQYQAGILDDPDSLSKKYIKDSITRVFNRDGRLERNAEMEADCKYVMKKAGETGIAFYAADPFFTNNLTALAQRGGIAGFGYANGITSTAGQHQWRFEESGRGYLESLQRETDYYPNRRNRYVNGGTLYSLEFSNGSHTSPVDGGDQERMLIRGSISWTNEIEWENDIYAMGGIDVYRRKVWNFQDMWTNFSCIMDEVTDELDDRLNGMGDIYYRLRATGTSEDIELADEAMLICEKLDAMRRARAYYNLVENEDHNYVVGPVLNLLYEWVTSGESHVGNNFKLNMYTNEDFSPVESITEAVENAITACDSSYIKYNAMAISEGTTITSQTEYDLMNYVIENAAGGPAAVRAQLRDLVDLENVRNGVIAHKSRELNFLNGMLVVADTKFTQYVHQGVGDTYSEAAADPLTTANVLDELLKDQKADVSAVAAELQRFIKARSMRLPTDDAIAFIEERINWADALYAGISLDAFGPYAKEALKEHIDWLKELLSSVKEGGEIMDEAAQLDMKKAELETERLKALDENDLDNAEALEREIENVQRQLDDANDEKNRTAASGTATAAEVANAEVSNTSRAVANNIADEALEKIAEGKLDDIPDKIDVLETMGSPRIDDVVKALKDHGAPPSLIRQAEEALANIGDSIFADEYPELDPDFNAGTGGAGNGANGNGDGNGDNNGNGPDGANGNGANGNGTNGQGNNNNDNNGAGGHGDGNGTGNGNGANGGTNGNGTGNNNGTGDNNGNGGNGGNGENGNGANGQGGSNTGNGDGGNGGNNNGDNEHGNGDDHNGQSGTGNNGGNGQNGSGGPGDGNGPDGGNNGEGDNGNGGGPGGGGSGESPEIPDYGPGSGLRDSDMDRAIRDTFGKDFSQLSDGNKAAVVAALISFANAREDKAAYDHAKELLDEMLLYKCPFIYRQYVSDYSVEYVSLAAVDKCRRYTKFRMVQKDAKVTMTQFVSGSASYVFEIGRNLVEKNNGSADCMNKNTVSQTDKSIRGSENKEYAYISENYSGKYLYCTCAYIPGTEWAILITPQVDKKIAQLLDRLDLEADGE